MKTMKWDEYTTLVLPDNCRYTTVANWIWDMWTAAFPEQRQSEMSILHMNGMEVCKVYVTEGKSNTLIVEFKFPDISHYVYLNEGDVHHEVR